MDAVSSLAFLHSIDITDIIQDFFCWFQEEKSEHTMHEQSK
jgi:hypothetical protein